MEYFRNASYNENIFPVKGSMLLLLLLLLEHEGSLPFRKLSKHYEAVWQYSSAQFRYGMEISGQSLAPAMMPMEEYLAPIE